MEEPTVPEILLRVIDGLPAEERERVMVWLLDRSFSASELPGMAGMAHAARRDFVESLPLLTPARSAGQHQVVPIRLPTDQHAALRDWCAEHGFSMATVVRGLVERFLEERAGGPAVARGAQD